MTIIEGIVLKERSFGEQDKFIDILTKEKGILEIAVKGAKKINGKSGSSSQLFAYSRFCLNQRKDCFSLNSAEPIHIFYGLRNSLSKLSLASYFADVLRFCTAERTDSGDVMRLFLNTLHYLEKDLRPEPLLKSIFELRLMSDIGFMPDVVCCKNCGQYEPDELFFRISDGSIYCTDCFSGDLNEDCFRIGLPVLSAVRHIVLSDLEKIYNFRVSDRVQQKLSAVSEAYLLSRTERGFGSLDFYKGVSTDITAGS